MIIAVCNRLNKINKYLCFSGNNNKTEKSVNHSQSLRKMNKNLVEEMNQRASKRQTYLEMKSYKF